MPNPIFNDISIPCFDLTWVELPQKKGKQKIALAFVAGGGGNKTKSGVLNKIVVFKFVGEAGVEQVASIDCQHGLCENICTAVIANRVLICASCQEKCVLIEVSLDKDDKVISKELASFGTEELSEEDMSINASCFLQTSSPTRNTFIMTGGENGKTHVWKVTVPGGGGGSGSGSGREWGVSKVKEFSHHKGPIKSIKPHPSKPWICTGGEDGVCRIVDINSLTLLASVNCTSDGVGASGGKPPQCRACAFSNDGDSLLTVQSGRMGDAHIVKWDIAVDEPPQASPSSSKKAKKDSPAAPSVSVSPNKVVLASKFPITRLSMSSEAEVLAVGDCNGAITTFHAESLDKGSRYQCHDFPVTGLGFAPRAMLLENDCTRGGKTTDVLFSCSADNKLSTILVQDSTALRNLIVFFLVVLLAIAVQYMQS